MGHHKTNPNSILKAQGKLQPKKKRLSKREKDALLYQGIEKAFHKYGILSPSDIRSIINKQQY